jgi:hypothetical protein
MELTVKGRSYYIERIEQETDEALAERAWFIIAQNPTTCHEFDEAVRISQYWFYMKNLGCRYSDTIQELVQTISQKMYQ